MIKTQEAKALGRQIADLIQADRLDQAQAALAPILAQRTPFRLLGHIGHAVGAGSPQAETTYPEQDRRINAFLDRIAAERTEGGWVVIGKALGQQWTRDPAGVFSRCRDFIVAADVWYGADILGERVPGPALVTDFDAASELLAPWRADANRWVRRAVGVSVHFWAKRSRGAPTLLPQARALLALLEPLFEEWEMDAAKGIGWGLKTLGKQYPEPVADWLGEQVARRRRRHRAVVLRKALTYLSEAQRARAIGERSA